MKKYCVIVEQKFYSSIMLFQQLTLFLTGSAKKKFITTLSSALKWRYFAVFVSATILFTMTTFNFCNRDHRIVIPYSLNSSGLPQLQTEKYSQYLRGKDRDRIRYKHTQRRLPQCIIIGVRKGGTRALLQFLNLHPSIRTANREMHFFDDEGLYDLGLEWYRKKMPYSYPDQITIEKTPAYFVQDIVPERIHKMNSSIKLILMLRDPVVRTISDYTQVLSNRMEQNKRYVAFEKLVMNRHERIKSDYNAIQRSIYYKHLKKWLRFFPLEQFLFINSENFVFDPVSELKRVETFLGIEHRITTDLFYFNSTKKFYCIYKQTRENETLLGEEERCLGETKGRKHPDVQPIVLQKLQEYFKPYNQLLYDITGIHFNWD